MNHLLQDIRHGARSLRRTPGFALTAVFTLALGIGLATAVFTVAEALLLRRLPVRDQERLVTLWGELPSRGFDKFPLGYEDAQEFARRTRTLERVAFISYYGAIQKPVREGDGRQVSRLRQSLVSGDFFDVLGTPPAIGRALRAADAVRGAPPVAVLSHAAWQRRYGGRPDVLGRQLVVHDEGVAYTIVGVMPQGLDFPRGTDVWSPVVAPARPADAAFIVLHAVGRLAPGATPAAARDEISAFFARPEAPAELRHVRGVVHTLPRLILGETRPAVLVFAAASALLLLITCVNVANLLLVRGLARVREVAVRAALGASRGRIVAQLLAENVILAAAGGALGVAVAALAVRGFVALAPAGTPRLDEVGLNAAALAGALGITTAAMLAFAVAPAVMTSRVELREALGSGARQSAGRYSRRATEALVAGQVALALLILSAAGLIGRSLVRLERAELSFDASRLLIGEMALPADRYGDAARQLALLDELLPRVRALPGVRAATPVVAVPFSGTHGWDGHLGAEGQSTEAAAANPMVNMEVVTPDYFATFGVPVLRGRAFTNADRQGAPPVVMVSESTARHFWPGADAVGKRVRGAGRTFTVVGVVPDTRYRDLRDARPSVYFPLRQSFFPFAPLTLAVRASGPPADLAPALRRVVTESAPGVALASAAPFESFLERPLAQPRLNALLLAVFAGAALFMAAVGLFGVMATMVRQRTCELGVRMALGATAAGVGWMVLRRGLALAAAGTSLGLLGALAANRLLSAMLFEVSPTDAPTLALVAAVLLGVAALASFLPARSGSRIEPAVALRAD